MSEPLKNLADVYYGKSPAEVFVEDSEIPVFGTGGAFGKALRALFTIPAIIVPRKGSLGNPQFVSKPFWAADTTYVVVPKPKVDARWLYYNLDAYDLTKLNEATGVPSINRDWLYRIKFEKPTFDEQRRIAEILSTVDEAMEQTEALIEKHEQVKAGLKHDLFTRGITPDGQLRPARAQAPQLFHNSPLGWIPKEWEHGGIEDYLIQPGGMKPGPFGSSLTKSFYTEMGYRVYGQEQILAGSLAEGDYYISPSKWFELRDFAVQEGDLLMTLVGVGTVGKVLVVSEPFEPGIINPRVMRFRPDTAKCCVEFLKQLIPSPIVRGQFNRFATGGTMPVLNATVVRNVRIPIIPKTEQGRIVAVLANYDAQLATEKHLHHKLFQQKQGLMQDLLTSRVRVKVSRN